MLVQVPPPGATADITIRFALVVHLDDEHPRQVWLFQRFAIVAVSDPALVRCVDFGAKAPPPVGFWRARSIALTPEDPACPAAPADPGLFSASAPRESMWSHQFFWIGLH